MFKSRSFKKHAFTDQRANGAETVEIVIGIICSVGLGAALLSFQGVLREAIQNNGETITEVFDNLAAGANGDI